MPETATATVLPECPYCSDLVKPEDAKPGSLGRTLHTWCPDPWAGPCHEDDRIIQTLIDCPTNGSEFRQAFHAARRPHLTAASWMLAMHYDARPKSKVVKLDTRRRSLDAHPWQEPKR